MPYVELLDTFCSEIGSEARAWCELNNYASTAPIRLHPKTDPNLSHLFLYDIDRLMCHDILSNRYLVLRISKGNEWKEASWEDLQGAKYNTPFPFANGLLIGTIEVKPSI